MDTTKKYRFVEIAVLIITSLISFIFFRIYDVLEHIVNWSRKYELLELDELISTSIVLVFALLLILAIRWKNAKSLNDRLRETNIALNQALSEVKELKGILPFCSFCKKVRNDQGYWEKVDVYIKNHSGAEISHGICPSCMEENYPEYTMDSEE